MSKIILFGFFGSGNIGNDSTLESTLYHVKNHQPDANIICICNGPQEVSRRFGILALPMSEHESDELKSGSLATRLMRLWVRLKDEVLFWFNKPRWFQPGDKFIVTGSGGVDDYGVIRPWHRPYVLYKWCKTAKMGDAQVIFLSVGAGPIMNRVSKYLMMKALRMADYRSFRDVAAFNYLHSIGYDTTSDFSYPDLVFSLPKEFLPNIQNTSSPPKVIGLGLINYYGHRYEPGIGEKIYNEYITKIKGFTSWLLRKGFTVLILPGDESDRWPALNLVEFINSECEEHLQEKLIFQEISDSKELFNQIAQTDLVVASRFHNVLCALMLERPVISLSYHEKNDSLMKEMNLDHYCQHIEQFSTDRLINQLNSCTQEINEIKPKIHDQVNKYRNLLDDQYKMILS